MKKVCNDDFQEKWIEEYRLMHQACIKAPPPIPSEITPESIVEYNKDFKNFYRFWSSTWLWILLFPILVIYVLWKQIVFNVRHVPKEYCKKASKFKNFAFILGVGHAIWRLPFVLGIPVFQLFRKRAIWRMKEAYISVDSSILKWYDSIYLYTFGLVILRDFIWYRYRCWSCGRPKDTDCKIPFSNQEKEKIAEKEIYILSVIPNCYFMMTLMSGENPISDPKTFSDYYSILDYLSYIVLLFLILYPLTLGFLVIVLAGILPTLAELTKKFVPFLIIPLFPPMREQVYGEPLPESYIRLTDKVSYLSEFIFWMIVNILLLFVIFYPWLGK